jgi:hypothetical protein
MIKLLVSVIAVLLAVGSVQAQELPLVDRGEARHLRESCRWLLKSLADIRSPLPAETRRELDRLLASADDGPEALIAIQKLLDPFCLVGVTINPESRVKGARGAAAAGLVAGTPQVFLIKVSNDAGVTHALQVTGPHLASAPDKVDAERWLHAAFYHGDTKAPPRKLSGHEVEYLILVCQAREAGKREAKFIFDVGQGTQDLGFRAEVPILFTVRAK